MKLSKASLGIALACAVVATSNAPIANAGSVATSVTLSAAPPDGNINAGDTVLFIVALTCGNISWSSTVELIDNNNNGAAIAPSQTVTRNSSNTETANFNVTFPNPGTYSVGVDATDSGSCAFSDPNNIQPLSITVTVAAAATTTVAPTTTTTVAPTTTAEEKEVLPATGSDNSSALLAVGVALAGAAILISRRRLLTK